MSERAPNMLHVLEQVTAADPERFRHAHRDGDPRRYEWIEACAAACYAVDQRFGLNGKRGNPDDISMDVIVFRIGPTDRHVQAFDVCGSCGGDGAHAKWDDITDWKTKAEGGNPGWGEPGTAIWVKPPTAAAPPAAPPGTTAWQGAHAQVMASLIAQSRPNATSDRAFVLKAAEQFAHSFPGQGWGIKAAAAGRPTSDNVLARQMGGRLIGYRIVPATVQPAELELTGQLFVPVQAVNHLGDLPPVPVVRPIPPAPVPVPAPVDEPAPVLVELLEIVAGLREQVAALRADVAALHAQLNRGFEINASSRYLGNITGVIRPKGE